ncbi:MAG: hypothetical protein UW70_C0046G0002 [Candidatus Peregrinibacteria bacterium GW2011_GWA2_44_7]|nr:MAG: hypothetical protein UW70_C0046G0002 [Candidatus Peregrinibacteria bacterium GW2011_GWA2_44_7]
MRSVAYLEGTKATNNKEDGLLGGLPGGRAPERGAMISPISSSLLLDPPKAGLLVFP